MFLFDVQEGLNEKVSCGFEWSDTHLNGTQEMEHGTDRTHYTSYTKHLAARHTSNRQSGTVSLNLVPKLYCRWGLFVKVRTEERGRESVVAERTGHS